jgi:hypothetical protein
VLIFHTPGIFYHMYNFSSALYAAESACKAHGGACEWMLLVGSLFLSEKK